MKTHSTQLLNEELTGEAQRKNSGGSHMYAHCNIFQSQFWALVVQNEAYKLDLPGEIRNSVTTTITTTR